MIDYYKDIEKALVFASNTLWEGVYQNLSEDNAYITVLASYFSNQPTLLKNYLLLDPHDFNILKSCDITIKQKTILKAHTDDLHVNGFKKQIVKSYEVKTETGISHFTTTLNENKEMIIKINPDTANKQFQHFQAASKLFEQITNTLQLINNLEYLDNEKNIKIKPKAIKQFIKHFGFSSKDFILMTMILKTSSAEQITDYTIQHRPKLLEGFKNFDTLRKNINNLFTIPISINETEQEKTRRLFFQNILTLTINKKVDNLDVMHTIYLHHTLHEKLNQKSSFSRFKI